MLRRLSRRFKAAANRAMSASKLKGLWSLLMDGSPRRNELQFLHLFGSNSRLGGPVDAIATDVSVVQWQLKQRKRKDGKTEYVTVDEHPLLDFLRQPHERLSFSAWIYVQTCILLLTGAAPTWFENRAKSSGRPGKMTPIPPHKIPLRRPKLNEQEELVWEICDDMGVRMQDVPYVDLKWPCRPNPADPLGHGVGRAQGVDDELYSDESMSQFNNLYFRNSAFLGAVVNVPDADLDTIEKEWKAERKGVLNAFKTLFTNSTQQIQVSQLTPPMKDLAFQEGRLMGRDFINQAFFCTPGRLGIGNLDFAQMEASDHHQQSKCTLPLLNFWREFFNRELVPLWGKDLCLEFVNPVRQTAEVRRQLAETGIRCGFLTVNEVRALHDYPPIQGGEALYVPINNVLMIDVSNGLKVPDIVTQLRLIGQAGPQQNPPQDPKKTARATK